MVDKRELAALLICISSVSETMVRKIGFVIGCNLQFFVCFGR